MEFLRNGKTPDRYQAPLAGDDERAWKLSQKVRGKSCGEDCEPLHASAIEVA